MDQVNAAKKRARIDYLAGLPGDSEIPKLSESVVRRAHQLIDMLSSETLGIVPTGDGEVMFEWYGPDGHVLGDITLSAVPDDEALDGRVFLI